MAGLGDNSTFLRIVQIWDDVFIKSKKKIKRKIKKEIRKQIKKQIRNFFKKNLEKKCSDRKMNWMKIICNPNMVVWLSLKLLRRIDCRPKDIGP